MTGALTIQEACARLQRVEQRYGCSARLEATRATVVPYYCGDPDRLDLLGAAIRRSGSWERPYYYVTLTGGDLAYGADPSREFTSDRLDAVLETAEAWAEYAHAKWLESQGVAP